MGKNTLVSTTNYSYLYSNSKKVLILLPTELKEICEAYIAGGNGDSSPNTNTYQVNKFSFLLDNGFFKDGDNFIELSVEQARLKMPKAIAFETTEKCNLECTYCTFGKFYHKTDYQRSGKETRVSTAITYIDYIHKIFGKIPSSFGFYGGEPLLNFKLISGVVEYLKKKAPEQNFRFDMTTNGLLVDRYADFLASNNFFILISLDGNEHQNRFRVFPDGTNSTQAVINSILSIKKKYPDFFSKRISFAATLPANGSKDEIDKFFLETFQQLPVYNRIRENDLNESNREEFNYTFGNQVKSEKGVDYFLNQSYSSYFRLLEKERKEQAYIFPNGTCLPFEVRHLITAQGAILPCEKIDYKYKLGTIENEEININPEEIARSYNSYIQKTMQLCSSCYTTNCSLCMFLIEWENGYPVCSNYLSQNSIEKVISGIENECANDTLGTDELWFYIESYVYTFHGNGVSMLYNSINGKSVKVQSSAIISLLKKLDSNINSNVVRVKKEFYYAQDHFDFFEVLKSEFMADTIDGRINPNMPFIPKNSIRVADSTIKGLQFANIRESEKGYILQHITRVDLYLDTAFDHLSSCERKQILASGSKIDLNINKIMSLFEKLLKLEKVFLYSNDVLQYQRVVNEIKSTRKRLEINSSTVFFINLNYSEIFANGSLDGIKCESIRAIDSENCIISVAVNTPLVKERFAIALDFFKQLSVPVIYTFLIEHESDIELFDKLASEYKIDNYEIGVVFNGANFGMFEQNVFVNEGDILSSRVVAKEVNIRRELNSNFFGKAAILPDGRVSCDLQKPTYAEISDSSLYRLIYAEITDGEGLWKLTRDKVEPCKACIYRFLCPPISDYELKLQRYNLCNCN
ncbi:MAG: radical SAM protein [Bacteroidales bacterium]|nr:radical SAM protein [Bacteroidales bacterium]